MTRSDLIAKLCDQNPHLTIHEIERLVDTIFGTIEAAMAAGRRVEIRDFGIFTARERAARTGRNPRTGENVDVSEKRQPFFKAGRGLLKQLNKPSEPPKRNPRKQRSKSKPAESPAA
jgi:integration host factor subunit beta